MEIEGLSPLQKELADRIWSLETPDQVASFFDNLPRNLLHDAYVVYRMIIYAFLDEQDLRDCAEAKTVIDHVRSL